MSTDRIEREIHIEAPVERVWQVVTQAEHLGSWFGDAGADIDLRPGGELRLCWTEHGVAIATVVTVEPPRRFSFRWGLDSGQPPADGRSTLVEFLLEPDGDTTTLRVVETGFAQLAATEDERAARLADNTAGWRIKLAEARDYARQLVAG